MKREMPPACRARNHQYPDGKGLDPDERCSLCDQMASEATGYVCSRCGGTGSNGDRGCSCLPKWKVSLPVSK